MVACGSKTAWMASGGLGNGKRGERPSSNNLELLLHHDHALAGYPPAYTACGRGIAKNTSEETSRHELGSSSVLSSDNGLARLQHNIQHPQCRRSERLPRDWWQSTMPRPDGSPEVRMVDEALRPRPKRLPRRHSSSRDKECREWAWLPNGWRPSRAL